MSVDAPIVNQRHRAGSGVPYEETYAYSRVVRIGDRAWISGTSALGEDNSFDPAIAGDVKAQARVAFAKIERALAQVGLGLQHIVRTVFYITDPADGRAAAEVHAEFFGEARPAFTMVGTPFLYGDGLRIEIEAEAVA
jgi:enamine deaminase RidA (YjgF/YER057c/UK114 family)